MYIFLPVNQKIVVCVGLTVAILEYNKEYSRMMKMIYWLSYFKRMETPPGSQLLRNYLVVATYCTSINSSELPLNVQADIKLT